MSHPTPHPAVPFGIAAAPRQVAHNDIDSVTHWIANELIAAST